LSDPAIEAQIRHDLGLDRPLIVQYLKWAWRVLHLDFGNSIEHGKKVTEVVGQRLLNTVVLALGTILFTWVLAVPIGIYSAVKHNTIADYAVTFVGFLGLAVPDFLLALALLWIGFAYFDLSVGGLYSPEYLEASWSFARVIDLLKHLWIPAIVLGTSGTAGLIRILRNNLLDELSKPYVVAARARGVPEWRLVLKYPVRIALNPFISTLGYLFPFLLSGSVIVSVVLSLPTLGPTMLRALLGQDLYLGAAIVLMLGVLTVIGTLISDILLVVFDPRIKIED
jgi:peptide/nickel transport system permease protein